MSNPTESMPSPWRRAKLALIMFLLLITAFFLYRRFEQQRAEISAVISDKDGVVAEATVTDRKIVDNAQGVNYQVYFTYKDESGRSYNSHFSIAVYAPSFHEKRPEQTDLAQTFADYDKRFPNGRTFKIRYLKTDATVNHPLFEEVTK
jgi:hypothetical protein